MKIAIFGDSFAHTEPHNESRAWYTYVKDQGYDVTNFGRAGSSLYYSYKEYLKHYKSFDKCIFLVTNWGRFHLPQLKMPHWPGIQQIEGALSDPDLPNQDRKVLASLYNWCIFARDDLQEIQHHELMLADILHKNSNTLLIPCFNYEMSRMQQECSLMDLHQIDMDYYKIDWQDSGKKWHRKPLRPGGRELRACHMNDENNIIFGNKLIEYINNNTFSLNIQDYTCSVKDVNYYFELADSKSVSSAAGNCH
jgi:hypothetical protein|tara:strand:- start:349 stop:1101 length:753 start_codon:yes stop_codon:yes gene_type:complete